MQSIERLISKYARPIYHFCRNMTNDSSADDLTQETFIRLDRYLKNNGLKEASLNGLVFSIANTVCIDFLRKYKRHRQILRSARQINSVRTPHEEYIHKELISEVELAVKQMPFKFRQVFLLREHSDTTFAEIAKMLNVPLNTVLARMNYALKYLREELKDVRTS